MKTLLLVSLLSTAALADNCYVHERGSESWLECKEQAVQSQREEDRLSQNLRDIGNQDQAAVTSDAQAEQINQALENYLRQQAIGANQ